MKFKYIKFNKEIDLTNESLFTFIIENRCEFINLMTYLNNDFIDLVEYFQIYDEGKSIRLDDYAFFIPNVFNLDLNTKKNINALYKKLKLLYGKKVNDDLLDIKNKCEEIVKEISLDFDIELKVGTNIEIDDLFKIMNISFLEDYENLKEKLIKYVLILNELNGYKLFIFTNLHVIFSKEDLNSLFKEISYHDISILNIENFDKFEKIDNEVIKILDIDNCSIE